MAFTQQRFEALSPKNRAKKMADLIREISLLFESDWKDKLIEYNQMCQWQGALEWVLQLRLTQDRLYECYEHWIHLAGLGLGDSLKSLTNISDLLCPIAPPLQWNILLHNLRSAHNVGSVIRTTDCFGLGTVHLSGYSARPGNKALASAAMGAENWIPIIEWDSPLLCINHFKQQRVPIFALETDPTAVPLTEFIWPHQGLVLLGNEELGIPSEILAMADQTLKIPMYGRKASLNVANAFSVLAHQISHCLRNGLNCG
jgi:tRNA(Leu) C34 or U34 (ribose-2'-O)-methylase TrmL